MRSRTRAIGALEPIVREHGDEVRSWRGSLTAFGSRLASETGGVCARIALARGRKAILAERRREVWYRAAETLGPTAPRHARGESMTASENAKVVLLSTCPQAAADGLARFLVEERHAACVNIIPAVRSVYRWQGAIESATESLLVIKTTAAAADALTRALVERHPYSVPEVVGFAIDSGHAPYLDWI